MPYGYTYAEIEEMIVNTVLYVPTARDIVRRGGLRPLGSPGVGAPVSVLSQSWTVELSPFDFTHTRYDNDPQGILWDPAGGFPETLEFWPTGETLYTTIVDLSGYVSMRNLVFVDVNSPNPPLNVRVEASLDGVEWTTPTTHDPDDWLYAGCNVNFGGWPAALGEEVGGMLASEWQTIAEVFKTEATILRWVFFVSPVSDGSPYDIAVNDWGALKFGYSDVQVG